MKLIGLLNLIQGVQKKIDTSQLFICGGVPRDKCLGHLNNISDLDLTSGDKSIDYTSQETFKELKKKYAVTRKTMPDGHSTIFIGSLKLDFSSNFNVPDIENVLKKMGISNPTSMQKEVYSRDFTCNSLLLSLNLKNIIDPTNRGFKDLKDKKIKTCLAPEITLTTNRNRVIRSIYLACKLGFDIDESIINYVAKNPESVKVSTEKVLNDKLNEAFEYDADRASHFLTKMNIWNLIPISEKVYPYYKKNIKGNLNVSK